MEKQAISTKQRAWLLEALQAWRGRGIVSEEQAGRILDLYETPAAIAERQRSRGIFTLMGVAALLVGLAVLLLIGYNWAAMPRGLKLTAIFGAVAAAHGGGVYLRYARQVDQLSEVAFFLGCLFYGAGIWLVAQIFHLRGAVRHQLSAVSSGRRLAAFPHSCYRWAVPDPTYP